MSAGPAQLIRPLGGSSDRSGAIRVILITSGRLSGLMEAKAARAGFPVLVSRKVPMNAGVWLVEKIGYVNIALGRITSWIFFETDCRHNAT